MLIKIMKIIILFFILFNLSKSEEPKVVATVNNNNVIIGEEIKLDIEINSPNIYDIIFPKMMDTVASFEIINISKIDTLINEKNLKLKQQVSLIQFDSGRYEIPSLKFVYKDKNDTSKLSDFRTFSTNSIPIYVNTVEIDTTKGIADIKPLLDAPFTIWEIIEYIYLTIGLILLALILWYLYNKYYKNRPKVEEDVPYDPKIPADILALEALRKLKSEKLWQEGEFKKYYTQLTDILRIYILRVFEIDALDMTSSEILENIKLKNLSEELYSKLKFILTNADLVKFAKEKPLPEINENAIEYAFLFVEETKNLIKKDEDEEE